MTQRPPRFVDLMRIRAFAVPFSAELQSTLGDQVARVALSILVFERTQNAAATALTYAATFLPAVIGGVALGWLADRFEPTAVMVGCDLLRAVLLLGMAVAGVPLSLVVALLILAVFVEPVFLAAQSKYLAGGLDPEQYRSATGIRMATSQLVQIVGFAVGGVVVTLIHPRGALLIDALTFAVSAAVIRFGCRRAVAPAARPTRDATDADAPPPIQADRSATWRIRDHFRVKELMALTSLAGLFVVPEGLAIPYAKLVSVSPRIAGLLLAAIPAGGVVGALLLVRIVPPSRRVLATRVMVVACGVPLILTAAQPGWLLASAAWFVSGAAAAYQIEVFADLANVVPAADRARVFGIANACLIGAQGLGLAVFGLVAQAAAPSTSIAIAGGAGTVLALLVVAIAHSRHRIGLIDKFPAISDESVQSVERSGHAARHRAHP